MSRKAKFYLFDPGLVRAITDEIDEPLAAREIDFVWVKGRRSVAFEVKASKTWRSNYAKVTNDLLEAGHVNKAVVVYRGEERYRSGGTVGLPVGDFLEYLYDGFFSGEPV